MCICTHAGGYEGLGEKARVLIQSNVNAHPPSSRLLDCVPHRHSIQRFVQEEEASASSAVDASRHGASLMMGQRELLTNLLCEQQEKEKRYARHRHS